MAAAKRLALQAGSRLVKEEGAGMDWDGREWTAMDEYGLEAPAVSVFVRGYSSTSISSVPVLLA